MESRQAFQVGRGRINYSFPSICFRLSSCQTLGSLPCQVVVPFVIRMAFRLREPCQTELCADCCVITCRNVPASPRLPLPVRIRLVMDVRVAQIKGGNWVDVVIAFVPRLGSYADAVLDRPCIIRR